MSQDYEKCEVIFPYNKVNNDELELQRGQVITILSKNLDDQGWWKGILNGKVGVFPDNFVKIIKNSSDKPAFKKEISIEEKYELNSLKKELEESAPNAPIPSKNIERIPSVEKVKMRNKAAQKKAAPSRPPPPAVATPEKDEVKVVVEEPKVEDNLDVIGSCTKLTQPTVGRVKPPGGRRPPSKLFLKENIPDLIDISIEDDEGEKEEKEEKVEKEEKEEKEEVQTGKPFVMKMLDISNVKLRETKPAAAIARMPSTTKDSKSPAAGWMEELSKKQANRRSLGNSLDQNSPEESVPKSSPFTRHNALRKPATGTEVKEDIGLNTDLNTDSKESKTSEEKESKARDDNKDIFNKKQEKNNEGVEITSLQKDIEDLKLQMLEEISSLKDELETERRARQALEKEILEIKRRI